MIKCLLILLSLLPVRSQEDLPRLQGRVDSLLQAGKSEIDIRFGPGTFFYEDGFLSLGDLEEKSISISGDGTCLVAAGEMDTYSLDRGYVDLETLEPRDVWEPVKKAGFWPLFSFRGKGIYCFPCKEPDVSPEIASEEGWTIILSQWYVGAEYPVVEIKNGWLYFRKDKEQKTRLLSELRFGRCLPRYMICRPGRTSGLYGCEASRFLSVRDCHFRDFSISGLTFLGNGAGGDLINFSGVSGERIAMDSCRFAGLHSRIIASENTSGLEVSGCEFYHNYRCCVWSGYNNKDITISSNRFIFNGLKLTNDPVVDCKGENFLVSGNYFQDFSYSAIGAGVWHAYPTTTESYGVLENNEICMSEEFRRQPSRMLIDSGAIYVWTNNGSLIIRDNYIHDIAGPHGNRGILCDDGSRNVKVYHNKVFRIEGTYCIDYRKPLKRIRAADGTVIRVHEGGEVHDNEVDGKCRIHKKVLCGSSL